MNEYGWSDESQPFTFSTTPLSKDFHSRLDNLVRQSLYLVKPSLQNTKIYRKKKMYFEGPGNTVSLYIFKVYCILVEVKHKV